MQPYVELGSIIDSLEFDIPASFPPSPQWQAKNVSASAIKNCTRQWVYELHPVWQQHARPVTKPAWQLAAAQGTWIHREVQKALKDKDLIHSAERYLPRTGRRLSGRVDGILTARPALLEIKTVSQAAWRQFPASEKFSSYLDQVQIYLQVLDLPEALLVCIRREPIVEGRTQTVRQSLTKEFIIQRDRQRGEELLAKVDRIEEALALDIIPPAEPSGGCFFCPFQHVCAMHDLLTPLHEDLAACAG